MDGTTGRARLHNHSRDQTWEDSTPRVSVSSAQCALFIASACEVGQRLTPPRRGRRRRHVPGPWRRSTAEGQKK